MRVKIRKWESMKKEFGLDEVGSINCECFFIKNMKHLCGKKVKIEFFFDNMYELETNMSWTISRDMITKKSRKKLDMN